MTLLPNKRAVFFDMDGVLVDSELQWRRAEATFFRELDFDHSRADPERFVGLGVVDLYELLRRDYGLKASRERFLELSQRAAEEVYLHRVTLEPGALALIDDLRARGYTTGLASASPRDWVRMVVDRFRLRPHFAAVVSIDDVHGEGKPSPAIYLRASGIAGIPPSASSAIEDSKYGVMAAKRAGMRCVGLRNGSNDGQDLSLADAHAKGLGTLSADFFDSLFSALAA